MDSASFARLPIVRPETAGIFDIEHGQIGDEAFLTSVIAGINAINPSFLEEIDRIGNRVLFREGDDEKGFDHKIHFLLGAVMCYALLDQQGHVDRLEAYLDPPVAS